MITSQDLADQFAPVGIMVPPPTPSMSTIVIDPVSEVLHLSNYQCLVVAPGLPEVLNSSDAVTLVVLGK